MYSTGRFHFMNSALKELSSLLMFIDDALRIKISHNVQ